MKLRWSLHALSDRRQIYDYINEDNPKAAIDLDRRFIEAAELLRKHPGLGRNGRQPGSREFSVKPSYFMIYEMQPGEVWILNVVNTSRRWPPDEEA